MAKFNSAWLHFIDAASFTNLICLRGGCNCDVSKRKTRTLSNYYFLHLYIRGWHVSSEDTTQWLFTDFELLEMKIVVFVACLLLSVNEPSVIRSGQFRNSVSLLTKYKWSAMSLSSEGDLCNPTELNDLRDLGDNVNDGFNEFFF